MNTPNANTSDLATRANSALLGMFIGDALAMPTHWYYNTAALRQDYGEVREYLTPKNPHPDSILWRSTYRPVNKKVDILHDQARYWGKKNIHYHQFLQAGENTLNVQLAHVLLRHLQQEKRYSPQQWLSAMIDFLTTPHSHRDTYVEEYLREFFNNIGKGIPPVDCGRKDEQHIGGYTLMLPLQLVFACSKGEVEQLALDHLALTHGGTSMRQWGAVIARTLTELLLGGSMKEALAEGLMISPLPLSVDTLLHLGDYPDDIVVGRHFSSACYVEHAVPATFYLALKYEHNPEEGLVANTMCGGDNCGRGAVLGALLGAANGPDCWPARWLDGLLQPPPLFQLSLGSQSPYPSTNGEKVP